MSQLQTILLPLLWRVVVVVVVLFKTMFIYFERERESKRRHRGGAERKGERESQAGSALSVAEPNTGLAPMNYEVMT